MPATTINIGAAAILLTSAKGCAGYDQMTDKHQIEIYIAMNEDGDYMAATDGTAARELLIDDYGGDLIRIAKLNVTMVPPVIAEASVTVPDDAGETVGAKTAE